MTAITPEMSAAIERIALSRGDVRVLMHRHQLAALDMIRAMGPLDWAFLLWTRRGGKSDLVVKLAHLDAEAMPGAELRIASPSSKHAWDTLLPAFDRLAQKLPRGKYPKWSHVNNAFHWDNGARCIIGSCDTQEDVERQKGTSCHRAYIEEAGLHKAHLLELLIASVIGPQFMTTKGNGMIVGTPPEIDLPDHPFWNRYAKASAKGLTMKVTLPEVDHIDAEIKAKAIEETGGEHAEKTRREYFVERVTNASNKLIPEWGAVAEECTQRREIPQFADWYCAADLGFHDLTVTLWGWYDFANGQLIIRHELVHQSKSGLDVGADAKSLEQRFGIKPCVRVADATDQLRADLANPTFGPGLAFGPAPKSATDDDAQNGGAALNQLRTLIQRKRIVVDPECRVMLQHLEFGVWNKNRTSFDRIPGFGHWDAIDALKYLSRVVNWKKNPIPTVLPGQTRDTHYIPAQFGRTERRRETLRKGG